MSEEKKLSPLEKVRQEIDRFELWLARAEILLSGVIEDYPIGHSLRGKCRLAVEANSKRGYRTVRETTDKNGKWCSPKYSTYSNCPTCVVRHPDLPANRSLAWLTFGMFGVLLRYASGESESLFAAPCRYVPRRQATDFRSSQGDVCLLTADDPELCDAFDAFERCMERMWVTVLGKMKELGFIAVPSATEEAIPS